MAINNANNANPAYTAKPANPSDNPIYKGTKWVDEFNKDTKGNGNEAADQKVNDSAWQAAWNGGSMDDVYKNIDAAKQSGRGNTKEFNDLCAIAAAAQLQHDQHAGATSDVLQKDLNAAYSTWSLAVTGEAKGTAKDASDFVTKELGGDINLSVDPSTYR